MEISVPVACVACGYNLRGLPVAGKCPECGTEASRSVPVCPRCSQGGLEIVALRREQNGKGVWRCGRCLGLGLDPGELHRTMREWQPPAGRAVLRSPGLEGQTAVNCGRCRTRANSFIVAGTVMVDRCGDCGFLWLDANEFEAIGAYLKEMAGSRQLPSNVDALLNDPAAIRQQLTSPTIGNWLIIEFVAAALGTFLS